MPQSNPKLSFNFPIRWLTEEEGKLFLAENVLRTIKKEVGSDGMRSLRGVTAYSIEIYYYSRKPVHPFPLSETQVRKVMKGVLPNATLVDFEVTYEQYKSETMLPLCDWRIYF